MAKKIGINGLGRIGKLLLWHNISRKYFDEIVVNVGREVGKSLFDLCGYITKDSTYGRLDTYLHGYNTKGVNVQVFEQEGLIVLDGVKVRVLKETRDPSKIGWSKLEVPLVVDTTGQFTDPFEKEDAPKGSLRGHLKAGAEKVILSAPFKLKSSELPEDAVTTVMGINENAFDPKRHKIISNASCTTSCLAHMVKPLIDHFQAKRILTISMATVHAATNTQEVLDRMPDQGSKDLRKNRSTFNNIILTSTGAATTMEQVIPEMKQIGFIAQSVRVPVTTGSLIILVVNIVEDPSSGPIDKNYINGIYKEAAQKEKRGYLVYTEEQNVSTDIIGYPRAAAIIEGHETETRSMEVSIDLEQVCYFECQGPKVDKGRFGVKVTQAVIYGWYDNELGCYVNLLGDRSVSIAEAMGI